MPLPNNYFVKFHKLTAAILSLPLCLPLFILIFPLLFEKGGIEKRVFPPHKGIRGEHFSYCFQAVTKCLKNIAMYAF